VLLVSWNSFCFWLEGPVYQHHLRSPTLEEPLPGRYEGSNMEAVHVAPQLMRPSRVPGSKIQLHLLQASNNDRAQDLGYS
jgi:hypothetical protein